MKSNTYKLNEGCNHPDLSLIIYNLNYRKTIQDDINIILNQVRKIVSNTENELSEDDKRFIRIQLDLVDTLRLFPLRRQN